MNPKTISVIVPVYNAENNIGECIESLLKLEYPKEFVEIIVVDNNSTDSTADVIKRYPVIYLLEKKKNAYNARNTGIKKASGEIIAFTDSDCIVDPLWLKNITEKFTEDERIWGVGGKIIAYKPQTTVEKYSELYVADHYDNKGFLSTKWPFIITANAAYRKEVFDKLGLFDGRLFSGGDNDMSWRVIEKGYKIVYESNAIVYHKHRTTTKKLFKQFFMYSEGHALLFKKHPEKINLMERLNILGYLLIIFTLFVRLPWRIITAFKYKGEDRKLYVTTPYYYLIQSLGARAGCIYGSIKYGVIML